MDNLASMTVFKSADILPVIIGHLSAYPAFLARLILVSKFVSDAAVDALWRTLPTSFYVLSLLPHFQYIDGQFVCCILFEPFWSAHKELDADRAGTPRRVATFRLLRISHS